MNAPFFNATDTQAARNLEIDTYTANGSITAGDVVALDTSVTGALQGQTVIKAALSATGNGAAVGIAMATVTAGKIVQVCRRGYVQANCVASTALSGKALVVAGTAGQLDVYASGTHTAAAPYAIGVDTSAASGLTYVFAKF